MHSIKHISLILATTALALTESCLHLGKISRNSYAHLQHHSLSIQRLHPRTPPPLWRPSLDLQCKRNATVVCCMQLDKRPAARLAVARAPGGRRNPRPRGKDLGPRPKQLLQDARIEERFIERAIFPLRNRRLTWLPLGCMSNARRGLSTHRESERRSAPKKEPVD